MARIFLSVIAFGLLIVLISLVLGAIAPWLILPAALLLGLLLMVIGVYQTAGPRSRNYRQIKPTEMSVGSLGGSWRFPLFYEQKIPTAPTPQRKTTSRPAARRATTAKARRTKRRSGE